jgi:hypothetical protein
MSKRRPRGQVSHPQPQNPHFRLRILASSSPHLVTAAAAHDLALAAVDAKRSTAVVALTAKLGEVTTGFAQQARIGSVAVLRDGTVIDRTAATEAMLQVSDVDGTVTHHSDVS